MNPFLPGILLLASLAGLTDGYAQKNPTGNPPNKQSPPATLTEKLLKFFGISDSPSTLKGPGDEVRSGDLWLANLDTGATRALTSGGGYRSPVFLAGTANILALRGNDVVEVPSAGGEAKKLYSSDSILKLVGSASDDPGQVLVLLRSDGGAHPRIGSLTVSTGAVSLIPYDSSSSRDLQMVESLNRWSRTYGNRYIFVDRQSKQSFSGTVEWSDVFLKPGNAKAEDISRCDGDNCGQPSLAQDGRLLVFVKAKAD